MDIIIEPRRVLLISIVVLWIGMILTEKVAWLNRFSIPSAVTGGLLCSVTIALLSVFADIQIAFDLQLRDMLLLIFFSTIGLSANFRLLINGGKDLAILLVLACLFLVLQNSVGLLAASVFDVHGAYGLLAGSISFAGGHGTGITYAGLFAERYGLGGTMEIAMACATFGLILGGLVGGPLTEFIIHRHGLKVPDYTVHAENMGISSEAQGLGKVTDMPSIISAIFAITLCLGIGEIIHAQLVDQGVVIPQYLPSLFVGIVITNLSDLIGVKNTASYENALNLWSDVSLTLFLSMSLMGMQLLGLSSALKPILFILILQMSMIGLFAYFVVFRVMGRDYDAAVITAGFTGLGLGATPVGLANMRAITQKFGMSPKAFLVIPLIGAFFIDVVNALILQLFMQLPSISG